jgi:hypothetical protein
LDEIRFQTLAVPEPPPSMLLLAGLAVLPLVRCIASSKVKLSS